jgi:hypothetical protein
MKNLTWAIPVLVLIVLPVALFAGCGSDEESNDAPRSELNDTTAAAVIAFPDTFGNLAVKCFGPDMVYSTRNDTGRGVAVSPNHPWCEDFVLTVEEAER